MTEEPALQTKAWHVLLKVMIASLNYILIHFPGSLQRKHTARLKISKFSLMLARLQYVSPIPLLEFLIFAEVESL